MGVSWVLEVDIAAKAAERILEGGGCHHVGTFSVDCTPYSPQDKSISIGTNYVLHHSRYPQSTFSMAPTDSYRTTPRAICDRGFDLILTKMSSGFSPDHQGRFEVTGNEYRARDFLIRVGAVVQVTTVKGVLVEVEYEPLDIAYLAMPMITEFVSGFFKTFIREKPDVLDKNAPEQYTPLETMWQYLSHFRALRKRAAPGTS
ncbi:unnamed protein product [Caenorhabditis auriculariae]|uniref:Mediator of RNA polymerase II transcription subunit 20 n=1 Tax=Caenorhabditis auriculariae TaxID=2777116 RepID=A0A8S1HEF3_9PELO|nr:unnamed protein product [Caenorhabditis auriculariae]